MFPYEIRRLNVLCFPWFLSSRIHPSPTAGSITAASSVSTVQGKPSLRRIKGRIHRSKSLDSIDLMDSNVSPPTRPRRFKMAGDKSRKGTRGEANIERKGTKDASHVQMLLTHRGANVGMIFCNDRKDLPVSCT